MSKWRPSDLNCLYVIPDIHGAYDLLEKILKRILPLRKSDGGQDKIVFLGDYIDRHVDSHKVLDRIIELKKEYGDSVICICGNHELMFLEGLGYIDSASPSSMYDMWTQQGGMQTAVGYLQRAGKNNKNIFLNYDLTRIKPLIPQEHVDFLMNDLDSSYEEGNFVFVHGGCDPKQPPTNFSIDTLAWDRSLLKLAELLVSNGEELPWDKTIVTGHNNKGGVPFINSKFMMLDCGSPKQLLVVEVNSMEAYMAKPGKRLVKYKLKETIIKKKKPGLIKRRTD